jgi:asparagine synthase (glutamine-hydrolysing)
VCPTAAWELTLLRMARDRGATAVLSGIGGDDVFDGDPRALAWSVCRGDVGALVDAARMIVPWRSSPMRRVGEFVVRPIAARLVPPGWRRALRVRRAARALPRWAGPIMRDAILGGSPPASARPAKWEPSGRERYEALSGSAMMLDVADARGQAQSAAGIVRLDPCLDPQLVSFVMRVPDRAMLDGRRLRGLFRRAMRGTLPDSVRLRKDKAAFEPAFDAMLDALGGLKTFANLATAEGLGALGIADPIKFREDFDEFVATGRDDVLAIWPALAVEAFVRAQRGSSSG